MRVRRIWIVRHEIEEHIAIDEIEIPERDEEWEEEEEEIWIEA